MLPSEARSGPVITATATAAGVVPEYECREAAVFAQVSWREWLDSFDYEDRAKAVAHCRMKSLIEAHIMHARRPT